jgi:MbtH protein
MDPDRQEEKEIYKVVINSEEQYSIWPADRRNAAGWLDAGKSGTKEECLAFIQDVWTDMRPRSVREKLDKGRREAGLSG